MTEGGFVVDPAASVPMSAGANFKVETAVNFVLLCPEYGGQILGHDDHSQELIGSDVGGVEERAQGRGSDFMNQ